MLLDILHSFLKLYFVSVRIKKICIRILSIKIRKSYTRTKTTFFYAVLLREYLNFSFSINIIKTEVINYFIQCLSCTSSCYCLSEENIYMKSTTFAPERKKRKVKLLNKLKHFLSSFVITIYIKNSKPAFSFIIDRTNTYTKATFKVT